MSLDILWRVLVNFQRSSQRSHKYAQRGDVAFKAVSPDILRDISMRKNLADVLESRQSNLYSMGVSFNSLSFR